MGRYYHRLIHKKHKKMCKIKKAALHILPCLALLGAVFCFNSRKYRDIPIPKADFYEIAEASLIQQDSTAKKSAVKITENQLNSLSEIQKNFYAVDKKTGMDKNLFNMEKLLQTDVTISKSTDLPKILIFHTHPHEMFADSSGINEGVLGAGDYLAQIMEERYGIKCLHIRDTTFDTVNGSLQRDGAYERMEPVITNIIEENPSIELVIDLHRDGVDDSLRLVENVNGRPCARIMFFNGLCMKWDNGVLCPTEGLENPYLQTNLALSLKMQMEMERLYPGLARRIYLNAYRYSLHMKDKSMLIELGAQTNTKEEIYNSIEILAEVLNNTVTQASK